MLSLLVPVVTFTEPLAAQVILVFFILFYSYSEWQKMRGKTFFAHLFISKMQRDEEKLEWARAPLFLALGVLGAISFFSWEAALLGIYQVGFCDTMAAYCGKKWGKTKLPFFSRKTYAGLLAYFITALPLSFLYLPPSMAITLSLVGAFLESLPFKDWDNLTIPVVISFLAEQFIMG